MIVKIRNERVCNYIIANHSTQTAIEMAECLHVGYSTVRQYAKMLNINLKRERAKKRAETERRINFVKNNPHLSRHQQAHALGITLKVLHDLCCKYRIERKPRKPAVSRKINHPDDGMLHYDRMQYESLFIGYT